MGSCTHLVPVMSNFFTLNLMSKYSNICFKLDKVEITSVLDPTINDQKIITSAHTGELVSSNKLASFEYLPFSGQSFSQLDIVDNEFDHLADQINILN